MTTRTKINQSIGQSIMLENGGGRMAEIQNARGYIPKKKYLAEEFKNQPNWSASKAALAKLIHDLDRGDIPDRHGNVGCFASVTFLASKSGREPRTIKRILAELRDEGVLIYLGGTEGGTARRRIHLNYDVRARVSARRKITEVINGLVVTRRLKKSELPEPVFCGLKCHRRGDISDTCSSSVSELRNTPISPFPPENGTIGFFSAPKPPSEMEPSSRISDSTSSVPRHVDGFSACAAQPAEPRPKPISSSARSSQAGTMRLSRLVETSTGLVSGVETSPKPRKNSRSEKHKKYHQRMLQLPGVALFFEDRFDLTKVSGADAAMFMRRWDDGSIDISRLHEAWEGMGYRLASEFHHEANKAMTETTFRSFIASIDKSCGHAVRNTRRDVIRVIRDAQYCLKYEELRSLFEGGITMKDMEFEDIRHEAWHTLNDLVENQSEFLRTESQLDKFSLIQGQHLAKRTFDETRERMSAPEVDIFSNDQGPTSQASAGS